MMTRFLAGLCLALLPTLTTAAAPEPLQARLRLHHVAADTWEADYHFDQPVSAFEFDGAGVPFRADAWRPLDRGVTLAAGDSTDTLRSRGKPRPDWRVAVSLYRPWSHRNYVPMDRQTDGGTSLYLGFFAGRALIGGEARDVNLRIELQGLDGETVLLPARAQVDPSLYVYFGPQLPAPSGDIRTVLDPATPAWIRAAMSDTAARVSAVYAKAFARAPVEPLTVLVGAAGLEEPGYSIKGGALPGQLVFTLAGRDLKQDRPAGRARLQKMVAHELAHVWQSLVARGGIGEGEAWVHEGGAEALALRALGDAGVWTQDQVATEVGNLRQLCADAEARHRAQPDAPSDWREAYACGFRRFTADNRDVFATWRALLARTETTGVPYSAALFTATTTP